MSCTVEMAPLQQRFRVAILDEVQLITDPARGFAWTRGLLGVQSRHLHLCGALDPSLLGRDRMIYTVAFSLYIVIINLNR